MRLETDYIFLVYSLIALLAVLALSKTRIPGKPYKILLAIIVAISMPSFIPGHGEIVMLIPNGALFLVKSNDAKAVGVIFTLINFFIAWFVLYKIFGLFKNKP